MDFGFWIGATVLGLAPMAFAQDRPAPARTPPAAAVPAGPKGRSLYQAQAATVVPTVPVDPSAPPPAPRSYLEVPPAVPKTIRKHDLVTIIIREESESSSTGAANSKKEATLDARLEEFIKLTGTKLTGGGVTDPVPSIKASGAREFKSDGTVDRTDTLTFRIG